MKCVNCGNEVREDWRFCPKCGRPAKGGPVPINIDKLIDQVMNRMSIKMKNVDKNMEKNFEMIDISPFFRKPVKGRGFSIKITSGSGMSPKVNIKTYGDVDKKKVQKEAKEMTQEMGIKAKDKDFSLFKKAEEPAVTEEPKTTVKRLGNRILVEIELPGVKDQKDIEIRDMENSIEVKATAGKKALFKIITKPSQLKVKDKKFENGKLNLELS